MSGGTKEMKSRQWCSNRKLQIVSLGCCHTCLVPQSGNICLRWCTSSLVMHACAGPRIWPCGPDCYTVQHKTSLS